VEEVKPSTVQNVASVMQDTWDTFVGTYMSTWTDTKETRPPLRELLAPK